MERLALVTGVEERVEKVSRALEQSGWVVIGATEIAEVAGRCAQTGPGRFGSYVQLPWDVEPAGPTALQRAAQFLGSALIARYEVMGEVLPTLRPDACVVIVDEDAPADTEGDDAGARLDLLRALARTVALDSVGGERKSVVLGPDRSADEIAAIAVRRGEDRRWLHRRILSLSPDLDLADWRREVLLLTTDF